MRQTRKSVGHRGLRQRTRRRTHDLDPRRRRRGADPGRGSGIIGLQDRVGAVGGRISVVSPTGGGTQIDVQLPAGPAVAVPGSTAPAS